MQLRLVAEGAFNGLDLGRRPARDCDDPARATGQPVSHRGMLLGAIMSKAGVQHLAQPEPINNVDKADQPAQMSRGLQRPTTMAATVARALNTVVVP